MWREMPREGGNAQPSWTLSLHCSHVRPHNEEIKNKVCVGGCRACFLITPLPNLPPLRAYPLLNAPTSSVPLSGHGLSTLAPVVGGLCSCLSIRYYQPYFDVDTQHVVDRIKYALFPFKKESTFIQVRT